MNENYVKSPMNYTGGKYKLLSQIIPRFPKDIKVFYDMFCGGCVVGINAHAEEVVLNDSLTPLMNIYRELKERSYEDVLDYVQSKIEAYSLSKTNREGFNALRVTYNEFRNPMDLFVLMAYSFNNQLRFNLKGEFNVPFGQGRSSFNPNMQQNLFFFMQKLTQDRITLSNLSFKKFPWNEISSEDFVYADPPYIITIGPYNDGRGWDKSDETELLSRLEELDGRGVKFALSNVLVHKNVTNEILKTWLDKTKFHIHYIESNYGNCSYQNKDKTPRNSTEVLVTNY